MATTGLVREFHSFMSIKCKESPSPPDEAKMAPTELHDPNAQHVTSTSFEMSHQEDCGDSSPEHTSSDSLPMYPYSALQQMQAVYGGAVMAAATPDNKAAFGRCRFCDYISVSEQDFEAHNAVHFPFKCPKCNYMARTEGRLKSHENKFHCPQPPATWVGAQEGSPGKPPSNGGGGGKLKKRPVKCKMCDFIGADKFRYYDHLREKHEDPKLLKCDQCNFATHYKHHLEYHLRNHYGSKPYSCHLCNYSCVNKSMLNSHKKSHSNVYQFRCAECSYATKYCHSLKMHLVKYEHSPGETLNADGTPNTNAVIDVHGRRRGPKSKKGKVRSKPANDKPLFPKFTSSIPPMPPAVFFNPKVYNNFSGSVFYRPSIVDNCPPMPPPRHQMPGRDARFCPYCEFHSESGPMMAAHVMSHVGMADPKQLFRYNFADDEILRMRMQNAFKPDANFYSSKVGEALPSEVSAKPINGSISPPINGNSSDGNKSPQQQNQEAYFEWLQQQSNGKSQFTSPPTTALNLVGPKTSTPDSNKKSPVSDSYIPHNENPSVLDLSLKSSSTELKSDHQRTETSSPNTSQSSSTSSGANDHSVPPARNRRKGKAFKLDHYLKEDEPPGDFLVSEPEKILDPLERNLEGSKTNPESTYRFELPTNSQPKRKLESDPSVNNASKIPAFSQLLQNGERNFQQQFLNTPPLPYSSSTFQNGAHNAQVISSPSRSPVTYSPNSTTISPSPPDQTTASPRRLPQDPVEVPKVVIKTEPMEVVDSNSSVPRGSDIFRCHFCDLIFGEYKMYSTHMRCHSAGDPFTCGHCGVKCYDRVSLFNHLFHTPHPDDDGEVSVLGIVRR